LPCSMVISESPMGTLRLVSWKAMMNLVMVWALRAWQLGGFGV
jgi:hypothetical protein